MPRAFYQGQCAEKNDSLYECCTAADAEIIGPFRNDGPQLGTAGVWQQFS